MHLSFVRMLALQKQFVALFQEFMPLTSFAVGQTNLVLLSIVAPSKWNFKPETARINSFFLLTKTL